MVHPPDLVCMQYTWRCCRGPHTRHSLCTVHTRYQTKPIKNSVTWSEIWGPSLDLSIYLSIYLSIERSESQKNTRNVKLSFGCPPVTSVHMWRVTSHTQEDFPCLPLLEIFPSLLKTLLLLLNPSPPPRNSAPPPGNPPPPLRNPAGRSPRNLNSPSSWTLPVLLLLLLREPCSSS